MIWTKNFWKGLLERAIKTFAQSVGGLIAADTLGIMDVDWVSVVNVAGLVTLASIFTSIGNADFTSGAVTETVYEID